jgi:ABC-type polysaccharide/polyol phosphate transport system ATPase subunit
MVSVHLKNVTVSFPIYDARSRSLKRRAMSVVTGGRVRSDPAGRISTDASRRVSIRALDRIDLAIEHGTRIGLVERNGAGKSTLLRVLAGIYVPESGKVEVVGKTASLFGGSLGIDAELTGRENIELRGLYLGLSREEIRTRMDDVIAFTELGPFIDMPFRAYSAGMRARLDALRGAVAQDLHQGRPHGGGAHPGHGQRGRGARALSYVLGGLRFARGSRRHELGSVTKRLARIPNEHARDIPARHQSLALHLASSPPRRRKTTQAGGNPLERRPPFAHVPPQHGEGHDDDLQCRDQPEQRGGDILGENPKPIALAVEDEEIAVSPALTDPKCFTSARRN